MLSPARLSQALEAHRPHLRAALSERRGKIAAAAQALARLADLGLEDVYEALREQQSPGALPTAEHDRHPAQVVPFPHSFDGHRPARRWAARTLAGQTTVAVDGSQLSLADDLDPPIAAAQVGWFINPHLPPARHEKDVHLEILTDDEAGERVEVRRFELEVERLLDFMRRLSSQRPAPVCFVDDPLVIPFAAERGPGRAAAYMAGMSALLEASETLRVPLVGYTADPSARDLGWMLHALGLLPEPPRTPDASGLAPLLEHWGDRSCLYLCARRSPHLQEYRRADGSSLADQIAFCYLRVSGTGRPARLEVPRWLAESPTELDRVLDIVRAECIAGLGYPYALEAAHDAAVISAGDPARFARAFAGLCSDLGLPLSATTKAESKRRRSRGA